MYVAVYGCAAGEEKENALDDKFLSQKRTGLSLVYPGICYVFFFQSTEMNKPHYDFKSSPCSLHLPEIVMVMEITLKTLF